MKDPQTPEEWSEAVHAAVWATALHAARLYGLIAGGPEVDMARCDAVLDAARRRGIVIPTLEEVLAQWSDVERPR